MFINLSKQTENKVTLKVIVEGIFRAQFNYSGSMKTETIFSGQLSKEYPLGLVKDLLKQRDRWSVILINGLDEDVFVKVQFEWFEEGSENPIFTWIPGEAKEGKVKVLANNKFEVGSSNIYV